MFCVNVKSKEFEGTCSRLNIHPSSLETIVFQYLNNIDSNGFPSDSYIMEKLQGVQMTNASNEQIQLWEKVHSKPMILKTAEQVAAKIKELSKCYTPESISSYRNNNGDYVITVAEPINQEAIEKEITNILVNAPRNSEGQLLAPNGNPTKLTERQYAHVRTKAFKKWFGDWTKITQNEDGSWNIPNDVSKVIDSETGEPKVVYHGTKTKFSTFDIKHFGKTDFGDSGKGFYFAEHPSGYGGSQNIEMQVFLNIKNPYIVYKYGTENKLGELYKTSIFGRTKQQLKNDIKDTLKNEEDYNESLINEALTIIDTLSNEEVSFINSHDGVIALYKEGVVIEYVTSKSNQIKSATDNIGTYSTESDDIMYSYDPSSRGSVSFNTRERVKNHYLRTVSTSVERSLQTIETLQKIFTNTRISTADSNWSDAGEFTASSEINELAQKARAQYGNLADIKIKKGKDYYELQITPKSKKELEDFYTKRVLEYVRGLSNSDILNELLAIESDYYEDLAYHIKAKDIPIVKEQIAKKNANITAQEIEDAVDFLVSLENNPETNLYVNTCIKWLKNGVIRLPQDNDAILAIFKMAREEGFDVQKLKHPFDVIRLKIEKLGKEIVPGKAINPREIPQFYYSHSIETEEGIIEIYDVENSYEGQSAVSQALADTAPKSPDGSWVLGDFTSPWCLATFNYNKETGKATPSTSAKDTYWYRYNAGKRQIAFYNGIPIGFNSSSLRKDEWWDFYDRSHDNVDASFISAREKELKLNTRTLPGSIKYTRLGFAEVSITNEGELEAIRYPVLQYTLFFGNGRHFYPKFPERFSVTAHLASLLISIRVDDGDIFIKDGRDVINPSINESKKQQIKELITKYKEAKSLVDNEMAELIIECESFARKLAPIPKDLESEILKLQKFAYEEAESIYKEIEKVAENILSDIEKQKTSKEIKSEIPKKPKNISPKVAEAILDYTSTRQEADTLLTTENTFVNVNAVRDNTHREYMDPIEEEELEEVTKEVNAKSKSRLFTPRIIQRLLQSVKDRDYKALYNKLYKEEVNKDLENILKEILSTYHFEVIESNLKEVFGDDILGTTDFLNKVIYLAEEGDRNAITGVEEFAHAFVKLMGSVYHKEQNREKYPESKVYSEIRDLVEKTTLYKQVYELYKDNPQYKREDGSIDIAKIKEEAVGQALAAVISDRYQVKTKIDKSFVEKLKQWFRDLLLIFKSKFGNNKDRAILDRKLNQIADSILNGSYQKKFLNKLNDKKFKLQNYTQTILDSVERDGGISLGIMQDAVACGGIITGSLSYRMQTPVYRAEEDSLHDIDIVFPLSTHGWHNRHPFFRNPNTVREGRMRSMEDVLEEVNSTEPIRRFKERHPNTTLMYAYWGDKDILVVNAIISENEALKERFMSLTGNFASRLEHFTTEEREQIRLVDFFFDPKNKVSEDTIQDERFNLKLANYKHSFKAKLKYGRAKDIYDYQTLNPVNKRYIIDNPNIADRQLMWQKKLETLDSTESNNNPETEENGTGTVSRTIDEQFIENQKALTQELENLYDLGLTTSDIQTLGTQLMYWISEHLTVLHNTPGELKRVYNIEGKDASTMSRKEIAELVTPKRLMEQCIKEFRRPKEGMGWKDVKQLNKIADNARGLLFLSSNTFTALEGFSIIAPGADFGIMDNIDVTTNEFNDSNDDIEIQEEEGSSEEHWMRANTTITLDERISLDVKTAISKCYRIGKDGKPVISKWGIKERIPYEEARNIIVNICNGCLTLRMMIDALDAAKTDYPWLPQLTEQIRISEDAATNGARSQLQSAFFRDMYMARNTYSVVSKSENKFESVIVNENTALREITNSIITEFTMGSHPLFGNELGVASYNELVRLYDTIKDITEVTEENRDTIINSLLGIYNHLGFYNINEDLVKSILTKENIISIASSLKDLLLKTVEGYKTQQKTGNKYYPFEYSVGKSAPNSVLGNLRAILRIPASKIENTTAFSIYDNGKMHQSFCTPSYLFKLMTKFQLKDEQAFKQFMESEYNQYQWFTINENGKITYRASWLQEMIDDPNTREILKHKIQLNFNKHNYMRNMTSHEYALSVIAEFFSEKSKLKGRDVAWYRVPMLSNKPSSEFIRFVRYTGPTYKTVIADKLYDVYSQELSRIQTVRLRRQNPKEVEYISNFDEKGAEFCFLTFLNSHLGTDSALGQIIERRLNGDNSSELLKQERSAVIKAITEWMNSRSSEILSQWTSNGILEKASNIANIGDNKIVVRANLENFIWNDVLASINIQELTITDPSLYKDTEDIQKRIAQIHSPGVRPHVEAVDFDGNRVSDGMHRAATFADFEDVISNVIDNITIICDRKIATAEARLEEGTGTSVEVEEAKAFKELLVGKDGLYRQINATDAQAYSSATSYRKKAISLGKWSKSAEYVYKKLVNGEYVTMSDIKTAFQPLKPFVYSQIPKSSGVQNAPMTTLKVGIQNKNSEYLLIMAEALLQNEDTGKPNLLRAISEFMEESAERFPTKGIDTVQFASAVKTGKQKRLIDITKAKSVEEAKEIMRAFVFADYVRGTWDTYVPKDLDNPYTEKVDTMPMEDWSIQQEIPAHFRDHQQAEGSQMRAIIPSDLPSVDANGNPVVFATHYTVDGKPENPKNNVEFQREWEETHAANVEESIDTIVQELKLDSLSKKDRNIAISRLLQREILANPNRYGTDLLIACSLDENYNFRIPLGDPIQSKRVEQLLNSVVKNRINKQTIAGGPIVQVSNFGTSRQLNIVFNDKDGKPLRKKKQNETDEEYKKYIEENQAGIAYMECLAPAYTKELFTNFMDDEGNIDIEAIEKTSPELLKMIGFRIPTEDKYSIAPLKIVGFLPRVAGDGIMLPYDITLINGSDFDIKFIGVIKPL